MAAAKAGKGGRTKPERAIVNDIYSVGNGEPLKVVEGGRGTLSDLF